MGVGFFLGILQPGNSLQLSRERAAASRFLPRLCPESGRLDQRRAPGTLRPTHAENQLRALAGPGFSPQHTRSLNSCGPPGHSPPLSYSPNPEKVRPPLQPHAETPRTDVPVRGLEGEGGAGKWASPAPTGAEALPSRPPDSAPVASSTANGDWSQRQMTRKYVTGGAAPWPWGGVKGRLSGRPLLTSGVQVDAIGGSCTQVILPLRGAAWPIYLLPWAGSF